MRRLLPLLAALVLFLAGLSLGLTVRAAEAPRSASPAMPAGPVPVPSGNPAMQTGAPRVPGDPILGLQREAARPEVLAQPTAKPLAATKQRAQPAQGARSGVASYMAASYGADYLALPAGPGIRARICGAGGCVTMTSTDAGPDRAMQRAPYYRVADLSLVAWLRVCGLPASRGLCRVAVTVLP